MHLSPTLWYLSLQPNTYVVPFFRQRWIVVLGLRAVSCRPQMICLCNCLFPLAAYVPFVLTSWQTAATLKVAWIPRATQTLWKEHSRVEAVAELTRTLCLATPRSCRQNHPFVCAVKPSQNLGSWCVRELVCQYLPVCTDGSKPGEHVPMPHRLPGLFLTVHGELGLTTGGKPQGTADFDRGKNRLSPPSPGARCVSAQQPLQGKQRRLVGIPMAVARKSRAAEGKRTVLKRGL